MTVYIAGPMTGQKDYNRPQFNAAEKYYKNKGFKVLNPAILPDDLPRNAYMPICLAMLEQADAIALLPHFISSMGAVIEHKYANYQGKEVWIVPEQALR